MNPTERARKKIAILQSNYIPWRGYFDLIAAVDEFILFDDVQYTKNDWRNRNRIKTPEGAQWITIPVGQGIGRRIRDVELNDNRWQEKHWKMLHANYKRAPHFAAVAAVLEPLWRGRSYTRLSDVNRVLIEAVCTYLGITTTIRASDEFILVEGRSERLVDLCLKTNAECYYSGPAAKKYLDDSLFQSNKIDVIWYDYNGYDEYPQLWGAFEPAVSILDLLFNCGKGSRRFLRNLESEE